MSEVPSLPPLSELAIKPSPRIPFDGAHAIVFLSVVGVVAVASVACPLLMEVLQQRDFLAFIVFACMGVMVGGATNYSLYLVFDRSHFGIRLFVAGVAMIYIFTCIGFGVCTAQKVTLPQIIESMQRYMSDAPVRARMKYNVFFPLVMLYVGGPLVVLMSSIPYWLGRLILGWRLVPKGVAEQPPKMAILHLFAATTVAAVALLLMRLLSLVQGSQTEILPVLLFFGIMLAICTITQLVAIRAIFHVNRLAFGALLAALPLFIVLISAVVAKVFVTSGVVNQMAYGVSWMSVGFTIILIAPMLALRLCGRELRAGSTEPIAPPPRPQSPFAESYELE